MPGTDTELNKEQLNSLKSIMHEKFPEFVEEMMENLQSHMQKILYGLEQKDIHIIEKSAHSLGSNSSYIGATNVHDLARQIEHTAEDQLETGHIDLSALASMIQDLQNQIENLKAAIHREVQTS